MRTALLATLLALAACDVAPESPDAAFEQMAADWQPGDDHLNALPGELAVSASGTFITGEEVQLQVTGAHAYEVIYLPSSTAGAGTGPCHAFIGDNCLGIQAPIRFGTADLAELDGTVDVPYTVTASEGDELCVQALVRRGWAGEHTELSPLYCADVCSADTDGDSVCDSADVCPGDDLADADGDGVCDDLDICPGGDDAIDSDGDGTPDACEADLSGVFNSYESEGRWVHLFQSNAAAALSSYTTFCEDRGMDWFTPDSQPDAQMLIDNAYAIDSYHSWIITKTPINGSARTFGGFTVTTDGGGTSDSSGFTAIRKVSTSYCNPEDYGYTRCWDSSHSYDWLVCESDIAPPT